MKQIKKILCGVMLTSFMILGSVSVFAGLGDENGGRTEPPSCQELVEMVSKTEIENSNYTEEVVVGDMNASAGHDWSFDPPPTPQPVPPGEEPPKITYRTVYIVGNPPISHR